MTTQTEKINEILPHLGKGWEYNTTIDTFENGFYNKDYKSYLIRMKIVNDSTLEFFTYMIFPKYLSISLPWEYTVLLPYKYKKSFTTPLNTPSDIIAKKIKDDLLFEYDSIISIVNQYINDYLT